MKLLRKKGTYEGPTVFVDGFHYPVGSDGHRKGKQPLVVELHDGKEVFVWGTKRSPKHQHVYEKRQVEIIPFVEDPADG